MAAIFASISLSDNIDFTTPNEISLTISAMHNNKAADCHGLCAEHLKLAGQFYYSILAYCFSAMFVNVKIPAAATETVICPTIKDKNGHYSIVSNYRPITYDLFKNSGKYLTTSHARLSLYI